MANRIRKHVLTLSVLAVAILATSLTGAAQTQSYLRLENNTGATFVRIYMSHCGDPYWGPDQLGDGVLSDGDVYTITNIRPGCYDIMFVDEDRDNAVVRRVYFPDSKRWDLTLPWLLRAEHYIT
jgi:hypothetical protein